MHLKSLIAICTLSLFFLGGCWDNVDIGKQNYAMLVALEGKIGDVKGHIQCSDPTSPEASDNSTDMLDIKGAGVNISAFIGDAEAQSDKLVTYEHLQLILLTPDFFSDNMLDCMQYFMSRAEVQKTADIVITDAEITKLLDVSVNNKPFYKHVCGMLASDGITSSTALLDSSLISVCRLQKDGHPFRVNKIGFKEDSNEVFLEGFGVFSGERFCGYVDKKLGEYSRWFAPESDNFYLSCLMEGENKPVGFRCVSSESSVHADKNGDYFTLKLKVDAAFRLNEYDQKDSLSPFDSKFYKAAENAIFNAVLAQCTEVIAFAQNSLKADFLGFSRAVENEHPDWWEENHDKWDAFFTTASIEYDINCSLITTGDLK